jgi:hypothetical protein
MKTIIFTILTLFALALTGQDVKKPSQEDNLKLLYTMLISESGIDFTKEISELRGGFTGTAKTLAEGIVAFHDNKITEGGELFLKIKENNILFELMVHYYHGLLKISDKPTQKSIDTLCRLVYETRLREKQQIERGCVLGLESNYKKLIKDDKEKSAVFYKWYNQKVIEFEEAAPGNWYTHSPNPIMIIKPVNDAVEGFLLGYTKPIENFARQWKRVNRMSDSFFESIEWEIPTYSNLSSGLEETRSHVLAGKNKVVEKALKIIGQKLLSYQKGNNISKDPEAKQVMQNLWGKYYYVKGLNFYLQGKNQIEKGLDGEELITGRKGALAMFYFCGLRGGESEWRLKAQKLYETVRKTTQESFGKKLKAFPAAGESK